MSADGAGLPSGYRGARPDVLALIDAPPSRVLDVGCGAGELGAAIARRYPGCEMVGLEGDAQRAALARRRGYRDVLERDLERQASFADLGGFDLIVAADVLEHLADPWATARCLAALLLPGGRLLTSIPNVRHYSTLLSLAVLGHWPYRSRGIHDRTHLRFFARADILALLQGAGLEVLRERRNLRLVEQWSWTTPLAKLLDFWPLRPFLTFQYLHVSRLHGGAVEADARR